MTGSGAVPTGRDDGLTVLQAHAYFDCTDRENCWAAATRDRFEVAALRAEVETLRAQVERVRALCDAAEQRGRATIPEGMTLSGCHPMDSVLLPWQVRAALDGAGMDANPIPDGGDNRG